MAVQKKKVKKKVKEKEKEFSKSFKKNQKKILNNITHSEKHEARLIFLEKQMLIAMSIALVSIIASGLLFFTDITKSRFEWGYSADKLFQGSRIDEGYPLNTDWKVTESEFIEETYEGAE